MTEAIEQRFDSFRMDDIAPGGCFGDRLECCVSNHIS